MNTHTITLSSNKTDTVDILPTVDLIDHTEITLDIKNLYGKTIPLYIILDWGDDDRQRINNDLYNNPERNNINIFNPTPLFNNNYTHQYYPSTSLITTRHLQILIYYSNNEYSLFTVPLKIISMDYHESIGDISLLNINLLPADENPKEYQFLTKYNNQIVEFRDLS